jgi:hypothetical protein
MCKNKKTMSTRSLINAEDLRTTFFFFKIYNNKKNI